MDDQAPRNAALSRRGLAALGFASGTALALTSAAQAQTAPAGGAESALARIKRTKKLRVAALVGEPPYFAKSVATGEWAGSNVEMGKDIAKILDVELEMIDSTYANSVIQLQTGKVDIALALTPTPVRSLSIDFTIPYFMHGYGIVGPAGLTASTWADINKPDLRIATDLGSTQETAARRFAPKAKITAFASRDEVVLALQSKRVDCAVFAALLGMTSAKKNPAIGKFSFLTNPVVGLPSCFAIQKETSRDLLNFLNVWIDYNRGIGQIREWLINGMKLAGIEPEDIPENIVL